MRVKALVLFFALVTLSVIAIAAPQAESTATYATLLAAPAAPVEQREAAALWLAALKDERGMGALIQALSDTSAKVRKAAILALERLGDPAAIPPLIDRLLDHECFYALRRALDRLDPSWRRRPEARLLFESFVQNFPDSSRWSLPGMKRPPWFALMPMIELDADGSAEFFTEVLAGEPLSSGDKSPFYWGDMIAHLAERNWHAAEPVLLFLLERDQQLGWEVAHALGKINPDWRRSDEAVALARRLLARYQRAPDADAAAHLCVVLDWIPLPEATPFLTRDAVPILKTRERWRAFRAMAGSADPQVLAFLQTFLTDRTSSPQLAGECLRTIADCERSYARPILLEVLADASRDDDTRRLAAILLLESSQPNDVEAVLEQATASGQGASLTEQLLDAVLSKTAGVGSYGMPRKDEAWVELRSMRGRDCVRKLEILAKERRQSTKVRVASLRVLSGIEDARSSRILRRLATNEAEYPEVRENALWALLKVDRPKAIAVCWTLLERRSRDTPLELIVTTVINEGEDAILRLIKLAGDFPEVRQALVKGGHAAYLPKQQAIESILILLGQDREEDRSETLISQLVDLEGDRALTRLSRHESPRVRAWTAYVAFRKGMRTSRPDHSTASTKEDP